MEHHNPDIYGDIKLAANPGTPGQVVTSQGPGTQAIWQAPPSVFSAGMSPPRFVIANIPITSMTAHNGTFTYGQELRLRVQEIPRPLLTDPTLVAQIELLRWRGRRGIRRQGSSVRSLHPGWVHPTHFMANISGGIPSGHLGGMRIGQHSNVMTPFGFVAAGDRPSEWPLLGADPTTGGVNLPIGPLFGNWFRPSIVEDGQAGSITAWTYLSGRTYNNGLKESPNIGVPRVTNVGHFAFRWSVFDAATNRRITGPMSMPFRVQFSEPLWHYRIAASPNIWERVVNPGAALGSIGDHMTVAYGTPRF